MLNITIKTLTELKLKNNNIIPSWSLLFNSVIMWLVTAILLLLTCFGRRHPILDLTIVVFWPSPFEELGIGAYVGAAAEARKALDVAKPQAVTEWEKRSRKEPAATAFD